MIEWHQEVERALADFVTVSGLAGDPVKLSDLIVEFQDAPHQPPPRIPKGKMAVFAFWWNGDWLKIGKVGPRAEYRYTYRHYDSGSPLSTLAGALANDARMIAVSGFDDQYPGEWIRASTSRVNILIASQRRKELLSLLEAYLHSRLKPRYQG